MIRNVGMTSALNVYRAALQLALNVVLAHFLSPGDFGQVALVLPITLFILLIGDFGVTSAIVTRGATAREIGAVASVCQGFGLALPLIVTGLYLAGALSAMPGQTDLLLLAFSLVATVAMVAVVPRAVLERRLAYPRLAKVETIANTTGFLAAISAAAGGAGVWSFVLYHVVMQALRSACFWSATRADISRNHQWRLAGRLMRFGGWVVAFNIVNYLMRNLDRYVVGGWIGTQALGIYALAYQVMLVPLMVVSWPLCGVLLSTLSRLADRPAMQREAFFSALMLTSCVTWPAMAFLAMKSELIFAVLLPGAWAMVGAIAGKLAVAGAMQSVTALTGALFMMQGKVRQQFWFGVSATVLTLTVQAVAAYVSRSLALMVDTYLVLTLALSAGYLLAMARLASVAVITIARKLIPAIAISIGGGAALVLVDTRLPVATPPAIRLLADAVGFAGGAALLAASQWRRAIEALCIIRRTGQTALAA